MRTIKEMSDRIAGWLLGLALGDALGAPHEFRNSKAKYTGKLEFPFTVPSRWQGTRTAVVGMTTDDTEMSLVLAEHIIFNNGHSAGAMAMDYMKWAGTSHTMGKNTRALFHGVKTLKGYQNHFAKQFPTDVERQAAQSNGALMRCGALALVYDNHAVAADCMLSNPSNVALDCNFVYTTLLRLTVEAQDTGQIDWYKTVYLRAASIAQTDELKATLLSAEKGEPRDFVTNKGWCLHGMYAAVYCLLRYNNFGEAMAWVITQRGDTDTNASIAAGILGAKLGANRMLAEPQTASNANILFNVDTTGGEFPRHEEYILRKDKWIRIVNGLSKVFLQRQQAFLARSQQTSQSAETKVAQATQPPYSMQFAQFAEVKNIQTLRPITVGIIGTAGRKEDAGKVTPAIFSRMVDTAARTIALDWKLDPSKVILVSGGSAVADHVAVRLWIRGHIDDNKKHGEYAGLQLHVPGPNTTDYKSLLYYHEQFSKQQSAHSLAELDGAVRKGAQIAYYPSFADRNKAVGNVDYLLAFTWGDGDIPKAGGTLSTWQGSSAKVKLHIPLSKISV